MRKIRLHDMASGGIVSVAISEDPDSFNTYTSDSKPSTAILNNLYPSLFKMGPDQTPVPDLCESLLVETHDDDPVIIEGYTKYTIDIVQNATWTDGTPVTASDVINTLIYALDSGHYGNPAWYDIRYIGTITSTSQYSLWLGFRTESYWNFIDFAFDFILPESVVGMDGIGPENWALWDPIYNETHPYESCGPFTFTDYEEGEFYELSKNPLFHYRTPDITTIITDYTAPIPSTPTTTTSSGPSIPPNTPLNPLTIVAISISAGSAIVILYVTVQIRKHRGENNVA